MDNSLTVTFISTLICMKIILNEIILVDSSPLRGRTRQLQGICPENLEKKFLSEEGKCQYSGFVPVKGSCTSYIPCISFGGDLMKPMKRTECPKSLGLIFDIVDLKCRPSSDVNRCLQRICFPKETMLEEGLTPPTKMFPSTLHDQIEDTVAIANDQEDVIVSVTSDNTTEIIPADDNFSTNIVSKSNEKNHAIVQDSVAFSSSEFNSGTSKFFMTIMSWCIMIRYG